MRNLILATTSIRAIAGLALLVAACHSSSSSSPPPPAPSPAPTASASWQANAKRWIAEDQRRPQAAADGFRLHAGDLNAHLDLRGIEVAGWRFTYAGPLVDAELDGSRVVYRRPGGVTEWYEARPEGIEQGFEIDEVPSDGDLIIRGDVESDEPARVLDDGLAFGELRYTGLAAWDASGRPLRATIEWDPQTRRIALRVPADELVAVALPVTIDPLLSTAAWTADSDVDGAYLGYSVASAGDVNGDGYGDIVVGAPLFASGQTGEGRAYVFLGSATGLSAVPAWATESNQAFAYFGHAVAGAGDVNGDGFGDVLVSANYYDNGQTDEGRAFLYLGSATGLAATAAWTAESDQASALFGWSVAAAGDVNGDGFADVVVGANVYDNGQTDEGRAYLYLGSASGLSATPAWTAESDQVGANFGVSVTAAGDVNRDGYGDVAVGAHVYDNGQSNEGRAFLYLGTATGLAATAVWTAEPDQASAQFGTDVASAGDVNGDGYGDVIVGAFYFDNGQTDEGRAFLYLGSATGLAAAPAWMTESDQAGAWFGYDVSSAGDVNGDGYGDVVVGAIYYDNGQADEGRAFLYLGSATGLSTTSAWTAESNQANAQFGLSVAAAGDVNGDGFADVVAGANLYDSGQTDEGRAYVYLGSATGLQATAGWTVDPTDQAAAFFGDSIADAGDVNGDGFSDVVVGAQGWDGEAANEGRAYVYLGGASGLAAIPAWILDPTDQAGASFGLAVGGAGDVNGDGFADVVVSALRWDGQATDEGRAFLYLGSAAGLAVSASWTLDPTDQAGGGFGSVATGAGDVNGDGFADVIICASMWDGTATDEGRAYVYLGSATGLATSPAWTVDPTDQSGAAFGETAGAGDFNGDGFSDVIVGARLWDGAAVDEGRAYLYLGSAAGVGTTSAWTPDPTDQAGAWFGTKVASAGDVNADGFGDVIVGASGWDGVAADEGRTYLYLGSATGPGANPSWTADPSDQAGAGFGTSVGSGDMNGDGFADVAVAAPYWNGAATTDEGRAYLFLGGAAGLSGTPVWTVDPTDQDIARLGGGALAGAGDINGDGFADLVASAYGWGGGEGRAYLYLGGDGAPGLSRGLAQYRADGTTPIGVGNATGDTTVVLKGRVTQEGGVGAKLRLQVEVKPIGTPFNGMGTTLSPSVLGGQLAGATLSGLAFGRYHWRARIVHSAGGGHGRWVSFGGNSEAAADFGVQGAANGTACVTGGQCQSGICEDGTCSIVACGLCSSSNAAGTACTVLPADDPACGTIDCDLLDTQCRNFADLTAGRCASPGICKAANGAACVSYIDVAGGCTDGNACTMGDACTAGACVPGAPLICDDVNGCTDDSCVPATGCVFADNSAKCDDGDDCTTEDVCIAGDCVGGADTCTPDAGISDAGLDALGPDAAPDASTAPSTSVYGCTCGTGGHSGTPSLAIFGLALSVLVLLRRRRDPRFAESKSGGD